MEYIDPEKLGLFHGEDEPELSDIREFAMYGREYLEQMGVYENVKANRNFYIGRQWEGIDAAGLPQPVFNIISNSVQYTIACITSDNISIQASEMRGAMTKKPDTKSKQLVPMTDVINSEFRAYCEQQKVPMHMKRLCNKAAVDGSCGWFVYWDSKNKLPVLEECLVENVFFGEPSVPEVEAQPYIMIDKRISVLEARRSAKKHGQDVTLVHADDWKPDSLDDVKVNLAHEYCTVHLLLWKDPGSGTIHAAQATDSAWIRKPWSLGLKRYPFVWFTWNEINDSYLGEGMVTGLLPNQMFINKIYAMVMVSLMRTAFPKIVYNSSVIKKLDNRVGGAIAVQGGNVNDVIKTIDPASISPQVAQFIELVMDKTKESLGTNKAALGQDRSDNTSALLTNQKASQTPYELTKQHIADCIEQLARICMDFWAEYYGKRWIMIPPTQYMQEMAEFAGQPINDEKVPVQFNFDKLADHDFAIKLDVGSSSYFSEVRSEQIANQALQMGAITPTEYFELIPDGSIKNQQEFVEKKKREEAEQKALQQQQMMMQQPQQEQPQQPSGKGGTNKGQPMNTNTEQTIRGGKGYGQAQHDINKEARKVQ